MNDSTSAEIRKCTNLSTISSERVVQKAQNPFDVKRPAYSTDEINQYSNSVVTSSVANDVAGQLRLNNENPAATVSQMLYSNSNSFNNAMQYGSFGVQPTSPPPGQSGANNSRLQRIKERRKAKVENEHNVRKAEEVNGFRGNDSVESLIQYIEGNKIGDAVLAKQKNAGGKEIADAKLNKKNRPKSSKKTSAVKKLSNPDSENEVGVALDNNLSSVGGDGDAVSLEKPRRLSEDSGEEYVRNVSVPPAPHQESLQVALSSPKSDDVDSLSSHHDSPVHDDNTIAANVKPNIGEENSITVEDIFRSVASSQQTNIVASCCKTVSIVNKENAMTSVILERHLLRGDAMVNDNKKCLLVNNDAVTAKNDASAFKTTFVRNNNDSPAFKYSNKNDTSYQRHRHSYVKQKQQAPSVVSASSKSLPLYESYSSSLAPNAQSLPSTAVAAAAVVVDDVVERRQSLTLTHELRRPVFQCRCPVEFLDKIFETVDADSDANKNAKDKSGCYDPPTEEFTISFGVDDFFAPAVSSGERFETVTVAAAEKRVEFSQPNPVGQKKIVADNKTDATKMFSGNTHSTSSPLDRRDDKASNDIINFVTKRWDLFMKIPGEITWYKK